MLLCALPVDTLQIAGAQVRCGCVSANVISGKGRSVWELGTNKARWSGRGQRRETSHDAWKVLKLPERHNFEFAWKMLMASIMEEAGCLNMETVRSKDFKLASLDNSLVTWSKVEGMHKLWPSCYGLNCAPASPSSHCSFICWNPNPQSDGIWRWCLWI